LIRLFLISGIFLIAISCKSFTPDLIIVRLTPDPDKPVLTDNSQANEAVLIIQHYRWVLKAYTDRYLVGEITEAQYNNKKKTIMYIISQLEIKNASP